MARRRITIDTQVFSLLSEASDDKWRQRFWRVLDQQYRYIISPLSMFELFFGLAASEGNHFATHQERFRQLWGPRTPLVLELPEAFAIKKALGVDVPAPPESPEQHRNNILIVLAAKSKEDIETGRVRLPSQRKGFGLDLADMAKARQLMITDHAVLLEAVRYGTQAKPTERDWARSHLAKYHLPTDDHTADALVTQLDAAYQYDRWLWSQSKGPYDYDKNGSDFIDSMQLYYLADPNMYLMTQDKKILNRIGTSTQKARIIDFDAFKAMI